MLASPSLPLTSAVAGLVQTNIRMLVQRAALLTLPLLLLLAAVATDPLCTLSNKRRAHQRRLSPTPTRSLLSRIPTALAITLPPLQRTTTTSSPRICNLRAVHILCRIQVPAREDLLSLASAPAPSPTSTSRCASLPTAVQHQASHRENPTTSSPAVAPTSTSTPDLLVPSILHRAQPRLQGPSSPHR